MNEGRLKDFYSAEWGKGAQTPAPRPTPPSPLQSEEIDSLSIR
jgi:hypothetical protein